MLGAVLVQMDYHSIEIMDTMDLLKLFVDYMDVIQRENTGETLIRVTHNKYSYLRGSPLSKQ